MNHCRKCKMIIPERYNWWPALRCSRCRSEIDKEFNELFEEKDQLIAENNELKWRCFVSNEPITSLKYELKKMKNQYELLRQQYSVILNDNSRLEKDNEKLRKWIERLFVKINALDWNSLKKEEFIS